MSLDRPAIHHDKDARTLSNGHLVTLYVLAVAAAPPFISTISAGLPTVVQYLAADAFIYLSIAANSQPGFYTFDGVNPTNGFHPLWQVVLHGLATAFGVAQDQRGLMALSFWTSAGLVIAASILIAQAARRFTGSALVACLTFPGLFGVLMLLCGWPAGSMWSFMNGMETPFSLLFFGLVLYYVSRSGSTLPVSAPAHDRTFLLVLSCLLSGVVLSRLDDVFLPAIVGLSLLLDRRHTIGQRVESAFWFGLPLTLVIGSYLIFNLVTVGHALPISGAAKFDWRTPLINIGLLGSSLHAMIPDFIYNPFDGQPGDVAIADVNWRNAQMLLPVIAARLLLGRLHLLRSGNGTTSFPHWMRLLLIYVIVKGIYNFFFVPLLHQGHWYYALSITTINIAAAILLVRGLKAWAARHSGLRGIGVPATAFIAALSLFLFVLDRRPDIARDNDYFSLVTRGPEIKAHLTSRMTAPRIIEADDGIINFALRLPTMSGFLFSIDPDAYRAYKEGRFLTEASRRGYQLIGSLYYLRSATADDLTPDRIPHTLRKKLFNATEWDLDRFDFALEYRDAATGAVFIRFTPKNPGAS